MKFLVRFFFISLFLVSQLTFAQQKMVIAVWPGSEKFQELIKLVYEHMKIKVEFVHYPTERSIAEVNKGTVDADIARSEAVLTMYPNIIGSEQYFSKFSLIGYVLKKSKLKIESKHDLKNLRVGMIVGTKIAENFAAQNGNECIKVNSPEQLNYLLNSGRIDVALIVTIQDYSILETPENRRLGFDIMETKMVHILNKKHLGLRNRFDESVKYLKANNPKFSKLLKEITSR